MSGTGWQPLARRLAEHLTAEGVLNDPAWREAFERTPRHLYLPRFHDLDDRGRLGPVQTLSGDAADHALAAAYADRTLVTRYAVAGTGPDGTEVRVPTSSASMPRVVAVMLDRLKVADGQTVLEIGTGTGYNAALLCARLGDQQVTSVELDEQSATEAAEHLAAAGHHPALVVGDGARGVPDRAPYDRIIATCSVGRIPTAWLRQLAPGGRIIAPLTIGSALAVLDRDDHGGAAGRIDLELVSFMMLRTGGQQQRQPVTIHPPAGTPHRALTDVDPRLLDPTGHEHDLRLWLALHQPDTSVVASCADDGTPDGTILTTEDSYATVPFTPAQDGGWPVTQLGTHRLWDTVETAYRGYERNGRPARDRLGVSANPDGEQYAWLDLPDGPTSWPMPS